MAIPRPNRRFVAVLVGCVLHSGCASPIEPTPIGPFAVTGRIIDYTTNSGIPGATVRFGDLQLVTDDSGYYGVAVTRGVYAVTVDGELAGGIFVRRSSFREDFLVHTSGCIGIYGFVRDARSLRSVVGATVMGLVTTDADGWYRWDAGCRPYFGTGTFALVVTHPNYKTYTGFAGRGEGFTDVRRWEVDLEPNPDR